MTSGLDKVRNSFGRFLVVLFWLHVPLLALVAWRAEQSIGGAMLAGALLASAYHLSWRRSGSAPATRYLSAVALMGEPALLVYLLSGDSWQMDMHMYFFAMLALTIAWCDRRAVLVAAVAVAVHHLALDYLLPAAVFPGGGDIVRVLLHAGIVAFQTAVLVWLSNMLADSFERIGAMSDEIMAQNEALEERTQEAEAANRAKSMFLANMSHEIRTPMNAVLGFCHLTLRTELEPRQRDYVTKINGAATALLRLINDILDFSKNEAGKLDLELRPFNLQTAVDEQLQLAGITAKAKGIVLRAMFDGAVPDVLVGDAMRFNQVLLNLVSNAVKFTERGSVTVSIRIAGRDDDTVTLEVSIADTGVGMSGEQLAGLFSSFTQADSSTTRRFGGTGLGLAISKQIVEQMGGTIRAESEPGKGSAFTFTCNMAEGGAAAEPAQLTLPSELSNLRVLIADDNPASREILQSVFTSWSMATEQVASGAEVLGALEAAERLGQPYDLLLLDWKMPGMDGIATVNAMRADPRLNTLPAILLVTAYGADDIRAEAHDADISAFLVKPVEPRMLIDAIIQLFARTVTPEREAPVPMVVTNLRGQCVLLAEDNEINREIAVELLTDAGLTVVVAENGQIAWDLARASGPAFAGILMDVQMPEMDGIEATVRIRKDFSADELPIIAMTAHAYEAERQRCFDAGMNDHIAKPVDPALLVETLNRWLKPRATDVLAAMAVQPGAAAPLADLPDTLPPFDLASALRRVNGKAALLRKLILAFGDSYGDTVATLREQVSRGSLAEARALAHTLKGVAASLEAREVAKAAAAIETAAANAELDGIAQRLAALEDALVPALAAAKSLTRAAPLATQTAQAPVDPALLAEARQALEVALQRRSLRARAAFEAFAQALGLSDQAMQAHPIKLAIDKLDFQSALQALNETTPQFEGTEA